MFDFSEKRKEKYFKKADRCLREARLQKVTVDRLGISILNNEIVKVYVNQFDKKTVSNEDLKKLKAIENYVSTVDRFKSRKMGKPAPIREEGYFTFKLAAVDK